MTDPYAESTVAMTAYNLLVASARPCAREEIMMRARQVQHAELTSDLFSRAVWGLIERKFVLEDKKLGMIWSADPKSRMVFSRNRDDVTTDEESGVILGGWTGWLVNDVPGGPLPIEVALGIGEEK